MEDNKNSAARRFVLLERYKNAALLMLLALLLLLSYLTWFSSLHPGTVLSLAFWPVSDDAAYLPRLGGQGLLSPRAIIVRGQNGLCSVSSYADADRDFGGVRLLFSEALGSAAGFVETGRDKWLEALLRPGIALDFGSALPPPLVANALGISAGQLDGDYRYLLITSGENSAELFLADPERQRYEHTTAYTSAQLLAEVLRRAGDSAPALALESPLYDNLVPETIVRAWTAYRPLQSSNPFNAQSGSGLNPQDLILPAFKMSKYATNMYTEADGSSVYVSGMGRLTLSPAGAVSFFSEEGEGIPIFESPQSGSSGHPSFTIADAYNAAREIISAAYQPLCGDASFYLLAVEESDGGGYRLRFGMMFGDLAVADNQGALGAASFDFRGVNLVGAYASLRHLKYSEANEGTLADYILPAELAAAALGNGGPPAYIMPVYAPVLSSGAASGNGIYMVKWSVTGVDAR